MHVINQFIYPTVSAIRIGFFLLSGKREVATIVDTSSKTVLLRGCVTSVFSPRRASYYHLGSTTSLYYIHTMFLSLHSHS